MRIITLLFLFLAGCGLDSSKLDSIHTGDTADVVERKMGQPQLKLKLADGVLWLWCAKNGPYSSHVAIAHLIDDKIARLETETAVSIEECNLYLKTIACKVSGSREIPCIWVNGERI